MNSEIISMNNIPLTVLEYFNDYHYSSSDDSEVVEYAGFKLKNQIYFQFFLILIFLFAPNRN